VFAGIPGQERAKAFFERALHDGSLSHAYLLAGPAGLAKTAFARELGAGLVTPCGGCGACHPKIEQIIDRVRSRAATAAAPKPAEGAAKPALTNLQRIKRIEEVIESEVRPMLQLDGGDIDLIDIEGKTVKVVSWYDNEWGYSNRSVDIMEKMAAL